MSVTIRHVARRAGVSIATVSRVLNGTSPVGEDKRRLVLDAVEALGYVPNPAALSLLGKRTGGLGVLLPFVSGEFFSELLGGLDEAAQELGFILVASTSHRRPAEFWKAVQALDKRVDGLVVMAPELDAAGAASLVRSGTPIVFLNTHAEGVSADVYDIDNFGGARALTRHLIGGGHRRIALVAGPPEAGDAQERARGYRTAMAEAGLPTDGLAFDGGYSRQAGFAAAAEVLAVSPRPTAVVAANDYCALGLLSALHQAGVDVPGEMSVCGFDGLASAEYAVPPLTTAHVPVREIGRRAVHRLAARLDGDVEVPVHETVPVEIMVRASTAPLADPAAAG